MGPSLLAALTLATVVSLPVATVLAGGLARLGFPVFAGGRRIGCIDGLRGYMALCVMASHFYLWVSTTRLGSAWVQPSVNMVNQLGAGSVALFFMTTGFLFYPRILAGFRGTPWLSVLVARCFRIVPLVTASVVLITVIIVVRTGVMPDRRYIRDAVKWIVTWDTVPLLGYPDSGRMNAYVLWSLWYEWIFYLLVLPACALLMDLARRARIPTWSVPAACLCSGLIGRAIPGLPEAVQAFLLYVPLFFVGMLAFELRRRGELATALSRPLIALPVSAMLVLGMWAAPTPYGLALPCFGLFFLCVACGNSLGGLLRTKGALVLGECSFGIYLLHGVLLDVLFVEGAPLAGSLPTATLPVLMPCLVLAVVLLTAATCLLVERPAMHLGKELVRAAGSWRIHLSGSELEVTP